MCGGGVAHFITDIDNQLKLKRNIFCFKDSCELIKLEPTNEKDMYFIDFDSKGQTKLDFIEFLFNDKDENNFLYARNKNIKLQLTNAILHNKNIPYLAPEMVLLYKSTDIEREGYQLDYNLAIEKMSNTQKIWLKNALTMLNPTGHKWVDGLSS